ncbi:MAG TPA: serine/threonine-protein kinase, partial [Acetobacteraceae bacterium]|nr:serine/threonine-protein kinase [Acetobacteraceae bacterium]
MEPSRKTLGRYELRTVLARGAKAIVYEGWDPRIGRRVAIKAVALGGGADEPEPRTRPEREAQVAGRLGHPNIVGIHDYGEIDDTAFLVMEFVDGGSLKARFDRNERFETPAIQRVMGGILAGLRHSHERGVIHGDITPSNILLTADGEAKLADFGVARTEGGSPTQPGTATGTPAYMAPEQFLGEPVDARADIYAAGVVLYQMLTGERPYDGGTAAVTHKVLHTEPVPPSQLSTHSSLAMDAIVARAMAKRRANRFPTASSFAEALQGTMNAAATDRPPITPRLAHPGPLPPRPPLPRLAAEPIAP